MQYTIREGVNPTTHIYTRAPTEEYAKTELWLLAEAALAKPEKATAIKAFAEIDPNFPKREFEKSYRESGRIKLFFNRLAKVKNGEFPWKEDGWLDKAQGEEDKGEGKVLKEKNKKGRDSWIMPACELLTRLMLFQPKKTTRHVSR